MPTRDGIWMGGVGSDIFGEEATARQQQEDPVNTHMRTMYMTEWWKWAQTNQHLHPDTENDISKLKRIQKYWTPVYALAGIVFAGVVYNPNFTSRNSFYLRKMTPVFFGAIGLQWGFTQFNKLQINIMLKNADYYPYEVRRTLHSKDYRYMVGFDFTKAKYDEVSGKCIS